MVAPRHGEVALAARAEALGISGFEVTITHTDTDALVFCVALVHGEGGRYQIATLDLDSRLLRIVSEGRLDESPSYAPNGSMIIYATETGRRGVLAAVSSDGRFRQQFSLREGNVREPVWSPMPKSR